MSTCQWCGQPLSPAKMRRRSKFCSKFCRKKRDADDYRKQNPRQIKLPTATTGAINELLVAADLMKRGYAVFRALSATCACDLAVLSAGNLFRVEVTTGSFSSKGTLQYPPKDPNKHDILAVVVGGDIKYSGISLEQLQHI